MLKLIPRSAFANPGVDPDYAKMVADPESYKPTYVLEGTRKEVRESITILVTTTITVTTPDGVKHEVLAAEQTIDDAEAIEFIDGNDEFGCLLRERKDDYVLTFNELETFSSIKLIEKK